MAERQEIKELEVKKRKPRKYQLVINGEKLCSKCNKWKTLSEYHKDKTKTSGVRSDCRACCMPVKNSYYWKNKKWLNKIIWEREKNNPELRQRGLERRKKYTDSEKGKAKREEWKDKNKDKIVKYGKPKSEGHKLLISLRKQLNKLIRRKKTSSTLIYLGCTPKELKEHIEAQFKEGMSWENYGRNGWHIDHIRPCASFNLNIEEDIYKCFNFKNLQPLWESENCSKGSLYNGVRYQVKALRNNIR